jgi:hypothetical protein
MVLTCEQLTSTSAECTGRVEDEAEDIVDVAACMSCEMQLEAAGVSVLDATFDDCDRSDWAETGDLECKSEFPCPTTSAALLVKDGKTGALSRSVDATAVEDQLTVCFFVGGEDITAESRMRLRYDVGGGLVTAWEVEGAFGVDKSCSEVCVDLSALDSDVNENAQVMLSFELSGGKKLLFDHVRVFGRSGDEDVTVELDDISDEIDRSFRFPVTADRPDDVTAVVRCEAGSVAATGSVSFEVPDAGFDAGFDAGATDSGVADAGYDAGFDAGFDAGPPDGGYDAGFDAGFDAGRLDGGYDAGSQSGLDSGPDAGGD